MVAQFRAYKCKRAWEPPSNSLSGLMHILCWRLQCAQDDVAPGAAEHLTSHLLEERLRPQNSTPTCKPERSVPIRRVQVAQTGHMWDAALLKEEMIPHRAYKLQPIRSCKSFCSTRMPDNAKFCCYSDAVMHKYSTLIPLRRFPFFSFLGINLSFSIQFSG